MGAERVARRAGTPFAAPVISGGQGFAGEGGRRFLSVRPAKTGHSRAGLRASRTSPFVRVGPTNTFSFNYLGDLCSIRYGPQNRVDLALHLIRAVEVVPVNQIFRRTSTGD